MGKWAGNCTLGDCLDLQRGTTYKGTLLGKTGPVLLGLGSIARNGGFKGDNLKTYGGTSDPRILLSPGDIYVSLKDVTQSADLLGAVSRVPKYILEGRLTQDTVLLVFKDQSICRDFIYWLLRTPHYRDYCRAHATGTTNLGLARDDFLAFPVPPFTKELATIISALQLLDDKIDLNRSMNETLEAMARKIFKDWFVDFGPTRAKMEGRAPYLAPEIWELFPDRLDDEGKPEGWDWGTLANYSRLNPESWSRTNYPGQIMYVDLSGTKWGAIECVQNYFKAEAPSRAQRILRIGDTIVGTVRPGNGSYALIGEEGLTGSTGFAVLRPLQSHLREFTYLCATSPDNIDRLAHLADGGAYPAVRPEVVLATNAVVASPEVLRAFGEVTNTLIERIEANKCENANLARTRDLLLPKLMSGEIRVKDAEKAVGEVL